MSSTRTGALTIEGRQRTFSTSIGVSDHGFKDYSQKMHEEHAAVALQSVFRGFKSRKNIHKSGSPRKTPKKRPSKSDSAPQYLIGGNNVVGIADWLGQALSAAFVSRIGLSVAELFDIIEYIARDDLDEFFTKSDTKKTIMTPQKAWRGVSRR